MKKESAPTGGRRQPYSPEPIPKGEIHVSRRRQAAGVAMPEPHAGTRPETILIIVIILASAWLAARGADPAAIVQALGGVGVSGVAAGGRLQQARRATPAACGR